MKQRTAFVLSLLMVLALAACGRGSPPDTGGEPVTPQHGGLKPGGASDTAAPPDATSPPTETPNADLLKGDSYWVAYESEGDEREYVPESDDLLTDLTLWADGTARIREIEHRLWLSSEDFEQNLTWKYEEDGTLYLYNGYSGDVPYHTGKVTEDGIELSRFGGTYRFRQESMPEGGALYSPAELKGVWLVASSEVEGYEEEAMIGEFETLVFQTGWGGTEAEQKTLLASAEYGGGGYIVREDEFSAYQEREITVLDDVLYDGCGNEAWSVRIGDESPRNEHDLPENVETYVTLLDQNTLLEQRYYSFDGGTIPGVSYRTYKRYLPDLSWGLEAADLMGGDFELTGYIDTDGVRHTGHPEYSSFYLHLDIGSYSFHITGDDGFDYRGGGNYWEMGTGGALQMTSEGSEEDWLAGAAGNSNGIPEIYLRGSGGILWLTHVEGSGGENFGGDGQWDGYVDTMDDLEGRAFAAPENTLFVLYNQNYTDMTKLHSLRCYEIDDGPDAQYVLVTSAIDGNYFWLDEDGFCREDFGTVDAGESFVMKVNLPESGGYLLQIESSMGDYFIEMTQNLLPPGENWNYFTT